jgi:hypothetical protein
MGELTMAQCWECESTTSRPIDVMVEVAAGRPRHLQLCPSCYQMCYLLLIAEASADGGHRDRGIPMDGMPSARRPSISMLGEGRTFR